MDRKRQWCSPACCTVDISCDSLCTEVFIKKRNESKTAKIDDAYYSEDEDEEEEGDVVNVQATN